MKKIFLLFSVIFFTLSGFGQRYEDDLYGTRKRTVATGEERGARREVRRADREQMRVLYSDSPSSSSYASSYSPSSSEDDGELVTSYAAALKRRVDAMASEPISSDSYAKILDDYRELLLRKYDKNLYNVMEFNSMMWVEPQDITALFDASDPAAGLESFNKSNYKKLTAATSGVSGLRDSRVNDVTVVVVAPWGGYRGMYGGYYSPWYSPWGLNVGYGWGGPGFSWSFGFGWGGDPFFDPYWGGGVYPGYFPGYWPGYYRPWYGPHGYYPGHGHGFWPGYYPGHGGSGRPVISGGDRRGAYNGSYRPGSASVRPGAGGAVGGGSVPSFRRGNNGTNVVVSPRPNSGNVRPGTQQPSSVRPTTERPSYERPTYQRPSYEQPSRPSYNPAPSRPAPAPAPSGGGGFGSGRRR